jgi:hypothetical protein
MIVKLLFLFSAVIVLSYAQTPITTLGTPIKDNVAEDQYKYYSIETNLISANMTSPDQILSFVLTSYSGDADLYISKTPEPRYPCDACILKGSTPRGEVKAVKKTDPEWPGENQKFYIGVHGYKGPASFLLNVFIDRVVINDGDPQMGVVRTGKYTYFQFNTNGR